MTTRILDCLTASGVDDSVSPSRLGELWAQFPFLEFAELLVAGNRSGPALFPSHAWLKELHAAFGNDPHRPVFSAHLCHYWKQENSWLAMVGRGDWAFTDKLGPV